MEVKVCKSCKRMFQYIAGPVICPHCREKEDEQFVLVKDYLRNNPGATLMQVSEATEVESKIILKFLREERLEVSKDSPISLVCEQCGKRIATGIRCNECEAQMLKDLNQIKRHLVSKTEDETKARMRFLDAKQYRK